MEMQPALLATNSKRRPMSGPEGPKLNKATKQASVYLPREMWKELDEIAEFHSEVSEKMGMSKVTRTDMIESFLDWAVEEYWADKGGKPASARDRDEKSTRHAEKLKAKNAQSSKK
jgi:hypothetical protein